MSIRIAYSNKHNGGEGHDHINNGDEHRNGGGVRGKSLLENVSAIVDHCTLIALASYVSTAIECAERTDLH